MFWHQSILCNACASGRVYLYTSPPPAAPRGGLGNTVLVVIAE